MSYVMQVFPCKQTVTDSKAGSVSVARAAAWALHCFRRCVCALATTVGLVGVDGGPTSGIRSTHLCHTLQRDYMINTGQLQYDQGPCTNM